jgi:hypothetical protein
MQFMAIKNIYSTPRDLLKFDLARNVLVSKSIPIKISYTGFSNEHPGEKKLRLG